MDYMVQGWTNFKRTFKMGAQVMHAEQLVRTGFRIASAIAPGPTGRIAFKLFCTPQRSNALSAGERRLADRMAPVIAAAETRMIVHPQGEVRSFLWAPENRERRGRVMLVHGWTGQALVMTAFVQPLLDLGYEVIAFDLPAHGKSTGRHLTLPLAARALQCVVETYGPLTGIITHSFGGPVAMLAMEGGAPLDHALTIPRAVLIAAPNEMARVTSRFGHRIGLSARALSALDGEIHRLAHRPVDAFRGDLFLRKSGADVLVIHDEDDADVDFANAQAIVADNPKATLMATKGLGHRRIIVARQVITAATDFLSGT
jgi:pimeloyl-ACP methyl ester carboxylesterase